MPLYIFFLFKKYTKTFCWADAFIMFSNLSKLNKRNKINKLSTIIIQQKNETKHVQILFSQSNFNVALFVRVFCYFGIIFVYMHIWTCNFLLSRTGFPLWRCNDYKKSISSSPRAWNWCFQFQIYLLLAYTFFVWFSSY